ncbi:MAG TPA: cysteine hydrolase [bacterium]|nr:cysteine hydrolase [bacterium]
MTTQKWRRTLENWPLPLPEFALGGKQVALLVVDMQHFCAHPDYGLGLKLRERFPAAAEYFFARLGLVVPNIARLQRAFRDTHRRVIFTTFGPELPDGADLPKSRRRPATPGARQFNNFARGTIQHSILPELQPVAGDLVINKVTTSAFTSTGIDQDLRHLGIEALVVTGVSTEVCVESTARDAADRGYECVIVEDACATLDEAAHEAMLISFSRLFGRVMTTEEVIVELLSPR